MIGAKTREDFDGAAILVSEKGIKKAVHDRFEHVQVDYWGFALSEGKYRYEGTGVYVQRLSRPSLTSKRSTHTKQYLQSHTRDWEKLQPLLLRLVHERT